MDIFWINTNPVTMVCLTEDRSQTSILSLKHKFEHTASCSSSSASAANSPFLIPSEFLLESSSERGNWYRVFRAFNRTCGNNRISMLINKKWKNVSMFCIYAFGQRWTRSDPGLDSLVNNFENGTVSPKRVYYKWSVSKN